MRLAIRKCLLTAVVPLVGIAASVAPAQAAPTSYCTLVRGGGYRNPPPVWLGVCVGNVLAYNHDLWPTW